MFKCPAEMKPLRSCDAHLTESRFLVLASAVSYRNMFVSALVSELSNIFNILFEKESIFCE